MADGSKLEAAQATYDVASGSVMAQMTEVRRALESHDYDRLDGELKAFNDLAAEAKKAHKALDKEKAKELDD